MILASHNSWSYHKPKHWYMYPFRFMAKCQNKDIIEQWVSGVRMFDLRIYFDKYGVMQVRHGFMVYDIPFSHLMNDLAFLDGKAKDEPVYVRVVLEMNKESKFNQAHQEWNFRRLCGALVEYFKHIKFIEGVRKFDWKEIYHFDDPLPPYIQKYSSTTSIDNKGLNKWYSKLDDWWPWLYAHLHNDHLYGQYIDYEGYLMMDFI